MAAANNKGEKVFLTLSGAVMFSWIFLAIYFNEHFLDIVFAPFFLIGLGIFIYGVVMRLKAERSAKWPYVMGNVSASEVRVGQRVTSPQDGVTVGGKNTYTPQVAYSYSVGGTEHQAHTLSTLEEMYYQEADAARVVKRFPAGKRVRVYYDPANPADAVLVPGVIPSLRLPFIMGGCLMTFSLLALAALHFLPGGS